MRVALLLSAVLLSVAAPSARAQDASVRFEITETTDTTLSFSVGDQRWVQPGQRGIAVDPRRRDVLVARFRVVNVRDGRALGVITGQTTAVSAQHVALLERPPRRFYTQQSFWIGTVLGAVIGAVAGLTL